MLHSRSGLLVLIAVPAVLLVVVVLRVEETAGRRLHLLVELQHLDYVCLLTVAGPTVMLLTIVVLVSFLVAKEVVLSLILIDTVVMPLVLVTAWNAILIDYTLVLLPGLVLRGSVGHDYLHGLQVLRTRTNALH